jgi:type IV pilus assembly protein PilW
MSNGTGSKQGISRRLGQSGLSLVELMVSILLGLILSAGIISVYLESKSNYLMDEQVARIQENGRFALGTLKRELNSAGFYAGNFDVLGSPPDPNAVVTDCAGTPWALAVDEPIDLISDFSGGFTTINSTTLTCLPDSGDLVAGSDILSVKRTAGEATLKNGAYQGGAASAKANQWYLRLQDYGDTFSWVYQTSTSFGTDFGLDTKVDYWEMDSKIFFIRNFSVSGDSIPTLCTSRLVGSGMDVECLVEGVEEMQIEFGIDSNGDGVAERYEDNPTAAQLTEAVVARVYLLIRSLTEIVGYTNAKAYQLGQKPVVAKNDGYMRRVFTTTVQMRNARLPSI